MSKQYRYRLQRKEPYSMPNILGNCSMPVKTYRWKDIAVSDDLEELKKHLPKSNDYRIVDVLETMKRGTGGLNNANCSAKMDKE